MNDNNFPHLTFTKESIRSIFIDLASTTLSSLREPDWICWDWNSQHLCLTDDPQHRTLCGIRFHSSMNMVTRQEMACELSCCECMELAYERDLLPTEEKERIGQYLQRAERDRC